jgi:hypothetical protein
LRIAKGTATEEDVRIASLEREMQEFRDLVNDSLDATAAYLLDIEFVRGDAGPVARLQAEGIQFELRRFGDRGLELRQANCPLPLMATTPGYQSANQIVCAIADHLDSLQSTKSV